MGRTRLVRSGLAILTCVLAVSFAIPAIAQDTLPLPAPNLRLVDGGVKAIILDGDALAGG